MYNYFFLNYMALECSSHNFEKRFYTPMRSAWILNSRIKAVVQLGSMPLIAAGN
jgi:hypothetical protein